jgi:hypothetical protein
MITAEQTKKQRDLLPMGWGRFGKAIDHLTEASTDDEALLAACVTLNPTFKHHTISLAGGLYEMTKSTNVVLAVTDRRVIIVSTGIGGAPRDHQEIGFDGLQIVDHDKRDITLRWPDGEATFKGAAKTMLPPLVEALTAQLGRQGPPTG